MNNTTEFNTLSPETLALIKTQLETALLKRGFNVPIEIECDTNRQYGQHRVRVNSGTFQTTPVLFKQIALESSGGGWSAVPDRPHAYHFGIGIYASWEVFSGGTNGTQILSMTCYLRDDEDRLYNVAFD